MGKGVPHLLDKSRCQQARDCHLLGGFHHQLGGHCHQVGCTTGGVGAATGWVESSTGGLGSTASMVAYSANEVASTTGLGSRTMGGGAGATGWVGSSTCGEGSTSRCTGATSTGLEADPCSWGGCTSRGSIPLALEEWEGSLVWSSGSQLGSKAGSCWGRQRHGVGHRGKLQL